MHASADERVVRSFTKPWKTVCRGDVCRPANVFGFHFRTPDDRDTVDLTATVTFNYRTSQGDYAIAELYLDPGQRSLTLMRPGGFTLPPTTQLGMPLTLSWVADAVDARGRTYGLGLVVDPRTGPRSRPGPLRASGGKVTVILEIT